MRWITCLLMMMMAMTPSGFAAEPATPLRSQVDRLAQPLLENKVVVGMVVGVIRDGRAEVFGYGETVRRSGRVPDKDTVYEIGSTSKTFTGLLLADAVQRKAVKLDDLLQTLLPAGVTAPKFKDQPITLEHLATHASALPRMPANFNPADPRNPYADYSVAQMYAFLRQVKLDRAPGEKYDYSNYGMGLLGHALATKQGFSNYEQLVTERLLKPLGMNDTAVTLNDSMKQRLAPPYDGDLRAASNWDIPTLAGAGGLRSTAADMLRYMQAQLDPGAGATKLADAIRLSHERRGSGNMALAWHISGDGLAHWHNGQTGGYHSFIAFSPKHKAAVVVLSNTAAMKIDQFGNEVLRAAMGFEPKPIAVAKPDAVAVDPAVLKSYEGFYALTPQFGLDVRVEDEQLTVQATGQERHPVYAKSQREFVYRVVEAKIIFDKPQNGVVKRLTLHQNGAQIPGARQD